MSQMFLQATRFLEELFGVSAAFLEGCLDRFASNDALSQGLMRNGEFNRPPVESLVHLIQVRLRLAGSAMGLLNRDDRFTEKDFCTLEPGILPVGWPEG